MIALGHSAGGALVGLMGVSLVESGLAPVGVVLPMTLLAGIGSHYIGDWIPHGHYRFDLLGNRRSSLIKLALDLVLPIGLLLGLAGQKYGFGAEWWLVATGILGALLPDMVEILIDLKVLPNSALAREHRTFHYQKVHWHNDPAKYDLPNGGRPLMWIDVYQLGLLALVIYLLV